jgi:hypothetical protein
MTRVQLPDGCTGLDMANGRKYTADKPGGQVEVSSRDSKFVDTSWYGTSGVMSGSASFTIGTRTGRWCLACKRLWQSWSAVCPRCGEDTHPEHEETPA